MISQSQISISVMRNLHNFCGGSPFYQIETDRVYWIDILKDTLNYWHRQTGQMGRWNLKQRISCVVPVYENPNNFVVATDKGIAIFDIGTETWIHTYINPEHQLINNKWSHGKCGPDGVFWIGSMNGFNKESALKIGLREGALYSISGLSDKPKLKKQIDYLGSSGGIAWSRSGLMMYHIDSATNSVNEYHYFCGTPQDPPSLRLNRSNVIVLDPEKIKTEGCVMDNDDNLWIALWGGYGIDQYSTIDGTWLNRIKLPDKYIKSITWFGPNLDKLFVTSAISDSLVTVLDQILEYDGENRDEFHKGLRNLQEIESGRVYVIDFSKTTIRGLSVNSYEIAKFKS